MCVDVHLKKFKGMYCPAIVDVNIKPMNVCNTLYGWENTFYLQACILV